MWRDRSALSEYQKLIKPPGGGLLAVTTGAKIAKKTLGKHAAHVPDLAIAGKKQFTIIGVPSDCGGGICRGAAHGPIHLRAELFKKHPKLRAHDAGDLPCIPHLLHDEMITPEQKTRSGHSIWGESYHSHYPVSPLNLLEGLLLTFYQNYSEFRPLVLGGDHSISGAVFEALNKADKLKNLGVLHFDAHTDLLEERFGVEHCFATWTSHALKNFSDPSVWVQAGIRASGKTKKHWESKYGLRQDWARSLTAKSSAQYASELIEYWKKRGVTKLYITNDIDGTDVGFAPSTGTPESGGLTPQFVSGVIARVSENFELIGADMMEVAPPIGAQLAMRRTIETAVRYLEALQWPTP